VNAIGDVVEPGTGRIMAGPRTPDGTGFLSTSQLFKGIQTEHTHSPFNTVIGVVASNARMSKAEANRLARMAQVGLARTIDPCHTMYDGDALFGLSLGEKEADPTTLGIVAAEVVAKAIVRAVLEAETLAGVPAAREVNT